MSGLEPYLYLFLFLVSGAVLYTAGLLISSLIRPSRPNEEKLSTYECGEEPVGNAWGRFNVRFYLVAMLFVLFEVEMVFLFPWAVVFSDPEYVAVGGNAWKAMMLTEIVVFIILLGAALVYAWKVGFLDWPKAEQNSATEKTVAPTAMYEEINRKYA